MLACKQYTAEKKQEWDSFVLKAKNAHFFFCRDYMDYHADRFKDHSLMIYDEKERLIAILPANLHEFVLYSHQGLTFGGMISDERMRTETMLEIFNELRMYLNSIGVNKLIYKCIPYIYDSIPAEEDRYALFVNNADLVRRDVSSTINLQSPIRYSKGRKWTVNKAKKEALVIRENTSFSEFWTLLENTIKQQHGASPVHTLSEITMLAKDFPKNIKLYTAEKDGELLAGAMVYENTHIVHTQYLANSETGRKLGALDLVIDFLIKDIYKGKKYFDFGISNENNGRFLNTGLVAQKEGFGARAVVHDIYELDII